MPKTVGAGQDRAMSGTAMVGTKQRATDRRLSPGTRFAGVLVAGLLLSAPAAAGSRAAGTDILGNATQPFVADVVVNADGQTLTGRLFHRPGMQRQEFDRSTLVRVLRFDLGEVWTLDMAARTVRRVPLDGGEDIVGGLRRDRFLLMRLGRETVAGVDADIFLFRGAADSRTTLEGTLWLSREGVLLRRETIARRLGETHHSRFELDGVRPTDVPRSLFEVPAGFRPVAAVPEWTPPAMPVPHATGRTRPDPKTALPGPGGDRQPSGSPASLEDIFRSREN